MQHHAPVYHLPHPVLVVQEDKLPGCHPFEYGVGLVIRNLLLQLEFVEMR